ncbi:hypothetical protein [Alteromonas sp. S005]|uniref:hypothetical protein n=1 Tax=Alteromonas sp. S005 TaxID=3117400 RepID=UPI002FE29726
MPCEQTLQQILTLYYQQNAVPAPAIFMLDKKGKVLFSYVNPDYKVRPSVELVLAVAKALKKEM